MDKASLLRFCLSAKGFFEIKAIGNSMSPSLLNNDVVMLANNRAIEPGDIAVYPGRRSSLPVVHRVVKIESNLNDKTIYLVGDNSLVIDACKSDDIIGYVRAIRQQKETQWHSLRQTTSSLLIANLSIQLACESNAERSKKIKQRRRAICEKWRASIINEVESSTSS